MYGDCVGWVEDNLNRLDVGIQSKTGSRVTLFLLYNALFKGDALHEEVTPQTLRFSHIDISWHHGNSTRGICR
jgi:hypothetical protein